MYFIHVEATQSVKENNFQHFLSKFQPSAICFLSSLASQNHSLGIFFDKYLEHQNHLTLLGTHSDMMWMSVFWEICDFAPVYLITECCGPFKYFLYSGRTYATINYRFLKIRLLITLVTSFLLSDQAVIQKLIFISFFSFLFFFFLSTLPWEFLKMRMRKRIKTFFTSQAFRRRKI